MGKGLVVELSYVSFYAFSQFGLNSAHGSRTLARVLMPDGSDPCVSLS